MNNNTSNFTDQPTVDSLALGDLNEILSKLLIFSKLILMIGENWRISCEVVVKWMALNLTDDKSTLAWCRQPTSHYLS